MDGFTQEIKNLAQMEFVQFWRAHSKAYPDVDRENLKMMYCAAFCGGAIAAQELTVIGFDKIKKEFSEKTDD